MDNRDYIFVKHNKDIVRIFLNDIHYIKADKDYCKIFTTNKMYYIHSTLGALNEVLPQDKFCQCNRSFILNISKIERVKRNEIFVEPTTFEIQKNHIVFDKSSIVIGLQYKKELLQKINRVKTSFEVRKAI